MSQMVMLNVGAGSLIGGAPVPKMFGGVDWRQVRLDADPVNVPDVLASMTDMSPVSDGSVDAVYSSHSIEHLYPNELPQAISEISRVLKPQGFAFIVCPDLQAAAEMIAADRLFETAYDSSIGTVTPFDLVYSHRKFTGRDKPYMSHYCGFTLSSLANFFRENGFPSVAGVRDRPGFALWMLATKREMSESSIRQLAERAFVW